MRASGSNFALPWLCAVLSACSGGLFQSKAPPVVTYMLSADLSSSAEGRRLEQGKVDVAAVDLAVQRPSVRTGLETDRIALLYPDRRLDYFANARWSGPLDQMVSDLAVQAFDTGAHLRTVSAESTAFSSGYWLEIVVRDFQAEYTTVDAPPTVRVLMVARLGAAGNRQVLSSFEASSRQPAAANRLSAIVDAYERAADVALGEIVEQTSKSLSDASEHR